LHEKKSSFFTLEIVLLAFWLSFGRLARWRIWMPNGVVRMPEIFWLLSWLFCSRWAFQSLIIRRKQNTEKGGKAFFVLVTNKTLGKSDLKLFFFYAVFKKKWTRFEFPALALVAFNPILLFYMIIKIRFKNFEGNFFSQIHWKPYLCGC
jgi:hypothetical protein